MRQAAVKKGAAAGYSWPALMVTVLSAFIRTVHVLTVTESQPTALRMGAPFAKLGTVTVTRMETEVPAVYDIGVQVTLC